MKNFCDNCGSKLNPLGECPSCATAQGNKITDAVANVTGLDKVRGFSWGELFSEAFKSHTESEIEEHWSAGSVGNIPSIDKVDASWPKPWVFVKVFLFTLVAYLLLYFGWKNWNATNLIPGLIIIGSFAVPLTLVIFFFEMNVRRNVSLFSTMKIFFVGGILSLIVSLFMFNITSAMGLDWLGASVAGIAEETGKLLAVVIIVKTIRYPYILNGLLFGAAIGAGFAAFESAGYALMQLLQMVVVYAVDNADKITTAINQNQANASDVLSGVTAELSKLGSTPMFQNILDRAWLVGLCGHVLWTGMSAGALWLVKGNRKFEWNMLFDIRFLRIFIIAIASHMLWNAPWNPSLFTIHDKHILLGIIAWIIIFSIIQSGLNQIKREKTLYISQPEAEPVVAEIIEEQTAYLATIKTTETKFSYDHLGINQAVEESKIKEQTREPSKFTQRAWQKYYKKDQE